MDSAVLQGFALADFPVQSSLTEWPRQFAW